MASTITSQAAARGRGRRALTALHRCALGHTRRWVAVLAAIAALLPIGAATAQEAGGASKVENARAALEKMVETRQIISEERRDWTVGKEMLIDRVELVKREIASLRERIADAEESISEADRKKLELVAENDRLAAAASSLGETVVGIEQRTAELLKRLPEPVRDRVQALSQRIPREGEESKLSLSERFMNVVGILNDVNKFNREITITSEVRALPDGSSVEVTSLYVGIGHGYYVNARGDIAGHGTATPEGWVWSPSNAAAPVIARAIAILKNEQVAEFVRLPTRILPQGN